MTIVGINDTVNKTCIRTTLSRLRNVFKFKTFIVDAYGWLHAAVKKLDGVVELLADNLPCQRLYNFMQHRIETLSLYGKFEVILVFDGPSSIQKKCTEESRQRTREEQRTEARKARALGDVIKATELFRASVDITPDIAKGVIDYLNELPEETRRQIGFKRCVVSINEADPQLCYLNRTIPNSCVVSRDFDMVAWGVMACIFKVDYRTGMVELFKREIFEKEAIVSRRALEFTPAQLIDACVLAGCDYVKNLRGVGWVTAVNLIRQYGNAMKVLAQWRKEKKRGCDDEYVAAVKRAITMFRYCWVVNEQAKAVVNCNQYRETRNSAFDINRYLDPKPNAEVAIGVYYGRIDPRYVHALAHMHAIHTSAHKYIGSSFWSTTNHHHQTL